MCSCGFDLDFVFFSHISFFIISIQDKILAFVNIPFLAQSLLRSRTFELAKTHLLRDSARRMQPAPLNDEAGQGKTIKKQAYWKYKVFEDLPVRDNS